MWVWLRTAWPFKLVAVECYGQREVRHAGMIWLLKELSINGLTKCTCFCKYLLNTPASVYLGAVDNTNYLVTSNPLILPSEGVAGEGRGTPTDLCLMVNLARLKVTLLPQGHLLTCTLEEGVCLIFRMWVSSWPCGSSIFWLVGVSSQRMGLWSHLPVWPIRRKESIGCMFLANWYCLGTCNPLIQWFSTPVLRTHQQNRF